MAIKEKLKDFLRNNPAVKFTQRIKIKSLNNLSLYEFIGLWISGISKGIFGLRIGAVSWALFFSIFPFLLFLFSVLPYAPLYTEIEKLLVLELIPRILPERITAEVISYVLETARGQEERGGISWIYILLTIFLSSNGIAAIINGFNTSHYGYSKRRKGVNRLMVSIVLTLLFVVFIITQLLLTYYSNFIWRYIEDSQTFDDISPLIFTLNFVSATLFYFASLVMLYYFGTNIKQRLRSVFPGATMATLLFFLTLMGFRYYIKEFNKLDLLYGSVGLVMIMMIFIYINVLLILIGFELNAAIHHAQNRKDELPFKE
ncbi:MAG: YihY/virulence factor BrkB family protein [Moheibacter sp.]